MDLKEIGGLPDYYVNSLGEVYSTKISARYNPKGELRLLRPRNHPSGYLYYGCFVGYKKDKRRIWKRGHRLVWETFNGDIPNGFEIDHIDNDKTNNRLDNLRLVTRSENMLKAYAVKRSKNL